MFKGVDFMIISVCLMFLLLCIIEGVSCCHA